MLVKEIPMKKSTFPAQQHEVAVMTPTGKLLAHLSHSGYAPFPSS